MKSKTLFNFAFYYIAVDPFLPFTEFHAFFHC